jgi:hypothetical protein
MQTQTQTDQLRLVAFLDDYGKAAWIAVMVLGFLVWWPIGLALLGFILWSGRMGCGARRNWKDTEFGRELRRWGRGGTAFAPTGNHAFDEYREETLRRLEDEATEFQKFLDRLRHAKDKAEFDQFMAERSRGTSSGA